MRKVALITGGGTGIGRSTTLALAAEGFDVVVNYSRSHESAKRVAFEAEALGARSMAIRCDVADDAEVRELIRAVEAQHGRLDALVNCAGITASTPPEALMDVDPSEWDRVFAVNVRGTFQVIRAAAELLRRGAPSAIVNLASIVGSRPSAQPLAYAASKAAVINLTKTLARVLAPEIRVNAVAPGWIEGEWMERTLGEHYALLMERRAKHTPMKRVASPEDVAETIVNLLIRNRFVTGQTVTIDGGYSTST